MVPSPSQIAEASFLGTDRPPYSLIFPGDLNVLLHEGRKLGYRQFISLLGPTGISSDSHPCLPLSSVTYCSVSIVFSVVLCLSAHPSPPLQTHVHLSTMTAPAGHSTHFRRPQGRESRSWWGCLQAGKRGGVWGSRARSQREALLLLREYFGILRGLFIPYDISEMSDWEAVCKVRIRS